MPARALRLLAIEDLETGGLLAKARAEDPVSRRHARALASSTTLAAAGHKSSATHALFDGPHGVWASRPARRRTLAHDGHEVVRARQTGRMLEAAREGLLRLPARPEA